jgi:hypothetical protein
MYATIILFLLCCSNHQNGQPPEKLAPFTHAAISPTVGPADGAATMLYLTRQPMIRFNEPPGEYVSVGLHDFPQS